MNESIIVFERHEGEKIFKFKKIYIFLWTDQLNSPYEHLYI